MDWDKILLFLKDNQFLSGGLLLGSLGASLVYLKNVPNQIYTFLKKRLIVTAIIRDKDSAFEWVTNWLSDHLKTRSVLVGTRKVEKGLVITLTPAPGIHFMWYKWRLLMVSRFDDKSESTSAGIDLSSLLRKEALKITIFGRKTEIVNQLINEAHTYSNPPTDKIRVAINGSDWWRTSVLIDARPLESVILKDNLQFRILEDIQNFINSRNEYIRLGIPYYRGYLLHGPPGNGKTSLVKALAGVLKYKLYCINLRSISDSELLGLLHDIDPKSILLIEDADCITSAQERTGKEDSISKSSLSLSGLLNALDGVGSPEGRVTFITTNHIDRLDSALIRPGRMDAIYYIGNPDKDQITKIAQRFFRGAPEDSINDFADIHNMKYSMALVQEHFIKNKTNSRLALGSKIVYLDHKEPK